MLVIPHRLHCMNFKKITIFHDDKWKLSRSAIHEYIKILGYIRKTLSPKQKCFWHVSLTPSVNGLTTGSLFYNNKQFSINYNFFHSTFEINYSNMQYEINIYGQSAESLYVELEHLLNENQINLNIDQSEFTCHPHPHYDEKTVIFFSEIISEVYNVIYKLKCNQSNETSPIQLWPHNFVLSMHWFSARGVCGHDTFNEKFSDEQINFGFSFGDITYPDPYFYITTSPSSEIFKSITLPSFAMWKNKSWQGIYIPYPSLSKLQNSKDSLLKFLNDVLTFGENLM